MTWSKYIPGFSWIRNYKKHTLGDDLIAGLTVGIMLIPQGMAYAMIAGLPAIYGLYASTIPLLIYALFGTSRHLAVGPVAMVALLIAAGITSIGVSDPAQYIAYAMSLALLVGLIQFAMGLFRLGFVVNFLSHPIISGFTSAAALIIGISQLKHVLGLELARNHHVLEVLSALFSNLGETNILSLGIAIIGIGTIIIGRKIHRQMPSALIAVVLGILIVYVFGLDTKGVAILGHVPDGLPSFELPDLSGNIFYQLFPIAIAIAFISFMESISVAKAIQRKYKNYIIDANKELKALGLANVMGSFFQSMAVAGGFSRTAVNDQAGAKTPLSSIVSASIIILTLLFLTSWFYYLPNAILAAIILVAVFGLIDINEVRFLWKTNKTDFYLLLATFFATIILGIEQGILAGVVLSLIMVIFRTTRPHIAVLGKVSGTRLYRKIDRFQDLEVRRDILVFRFDASLYFANVNYFKDMLYDAIAKKGPGLSLVVINADSVNYVDSTGMHSLQDIYEELEKKNIMLNMTGIKGPVRDAMKRSGLMDKLGIKMLYMSVQDAIDAYDKIKPGNGHKYLENYILQTNT